MGRGLDEEKSSELVAQRSYLLGLNGACSLFVNLRICYDKLYGI